MGVGEGKGGGEWRVGLFGCFSNPTLCIVTALVPCYTFGKNAEVMGENCALYGLALCFPVVDLVCGTLMRGRIREQRGIEGSLGMDLVLWLCCGYCALCQEAQELGVMGGGMALDGELTMERE